MNEKALIKKCQRGDKQAFEELVRLYYDYVSGFLLNHDGQHAFGRPDAGDLFEDDPKY